MNILMVLINKKPFTDIYGDFFWSSMDISISLINGF